MFSGERFTSPTYSGSQAVASAAGDSEFCFQDRLFACPLTSKLLQCSYSPAASALVHLSCCAVCWSFRIALHRGFIDSLGETWNDVTEFSGDFIG